MALGQSLGEHAVALVERSGRFRGVRPMQRHRMKPSTEVA